jgi:hypothetical protein
MFSLPKGSQLAASTETSEEHFVNNLPITYLNRDPEFDPEFVNYLLQIV